MTNKEYLEKQLRHMKGAKILDVFIEEISEEDNFGIELLIPMIVFERTDGSVMQLEILADAEGNDSAHIEAHMLELK